jgi:hypothetical protein
MLYLIIVQMDNHGHVCNKEIYRKTPSSSSHIFLDSLETLEPKLRKNSRKNTKYVFAVTSHYAFYAIFHCLSPPQWQITTKNTIKEINYTKVHKHITTHLSM